MKFNIITADPPYSFSDVLAMSDVKRSAEANYDVLDIEAIKALRVKELAEDDSVLALWVPSSLLQEGLDTMKTWGFKQTQTHIWVKIKIDPFKTIKKALKNLMVLRKPLDLAFDDFNFQETLAFGMGRLFRQTHEVCLLGVRGKIYDQLKNKSQRSVHFDTNKKHSAKPETLQNMLEVMFPNATEKLELFGRRARSNWVVLGNEAPDTFGEDIRDSISKLINQK